MSFLPIREPQNASSTDESSSGASDHDTDHHDYLINNSPAFFRLSDNSHDHDYDDATDAHPETPSEHSDHVSEASDGSHMDWSPISPVISAPGYSGSSSNSNEDDANTNDTTAESPEIPENPPNLLPLSTSSPDHLTHSHQQAMANRIIYDQILLGARFDPAVYTPVFLHDTLMLPGSLATVIGKETQMDILERLTPARLPSHTIVCEHIDPQNPCLVPSTRPSSPVATGLLLLGTGRGSRKEIKAHYRPVAKRQHLRVVIEVKVPIPRSERPTRTNEDDDDDYESRNWRLEARWVEAQVFVWKGAVEGTEQSWELGEAVSGSYDGGDRELDIDSMGGREKSDSEVGEEAESGNLRLDGDSGWAQPAVFGDGRVIDQFAVQW